MLLTNHTLTGLALGMAFDQPAALIPMGIVAHLGQDSLPHFGAGRPTPLNDPFVYVAGSIDFIASIALTAAAVWARPDRAVPLLCGVLGSTLPDLVFIPPIAFGQKRVEQWLPWYKPMLQFLGDIQWYERPLGFLVDIAWAIGLGWLLHAHFGLF